MSRKEKNIIKLSTLAIAALLGLGVFFVGCPPKDDDADGFIHKNPAKLPDYYTGADKIKLVRQPYLQNVGEDYVTVMFETDTECGSRVEWWSGSHYDYSDPVSTGIRHEIRLDSLPPNSKDISYRVRCLTLGEGYPDSPSAALVGKQTPFTLAPKKGVPIKMAVYGDSRSNPVVHEAIIGKIAAEAPTLLLNVGDLVSDGREYDLWDPQFFEPLAELIKSVPIFVLPGNHEHDASNYYELFSQPKPENYYAFAYGDTYHVVLDSNFPYLFPGSDMIAWLEKTVNSEEAQAAKWLIAYAHHPGICEGRGEDYEGDPFMKSVVMPIFEKAEVDIVFTGHNHTYERGEVNGVIWVVTGGGGAGLYSCTKDLPEVSICLTTYNYVILDIDGDTLEYNAYDMDGAVIESFTLPQQ